MTDIHSQSSIIQKAHELLQKTKERLTAPRIQVLNIIAESKKCITAYEILAKLAKATHQPKPPTIYRALEFWLSQGCIHRVNQLNAYVLCNKGCKHMGTLLMICDQCSAVTELYSKELQKIVNNKSRSNNFYTASWCLEFNGLCKKCNDIS